MPKIQLGSKFQTFLVLHLVPPHNRLRYASIVTKITVQQISYPTNLILSDPEGETFCKVLVWDITTYVSTTCKYTR